MVSLVMVLSVVFVSPAAQDEPAAATGLPHGRHQQLWPRLRPAESVPVNLANHSIFGCSISSSQGVRHPEALVSTDPTEDFEVPVGKSEAVIRLGGSRVINNVDFINDHIAGVLTLETSTDKGSWQMAATAVIPEQRRQMEVRFPDVQCGYLRLSFEVGHGGQLRGWDLYGPMNREDFKFTTAAEAGVDAGDHNFNLAAAGMAAPIYAFPTPTNDWETGMLHHVFKFPRTNERYRTIIYDLGSVYTLREFSVAYSQRQVRVELFLFEELPEKRTSRGRLEFDPEVLSRTKAYASIEDAVGHGHVKFKNEGQVGARYVVFRYEPDYNRKGMGASASLRWGDLVPGLGAAGALVRELISPRGEHRMATGDTGAPFEHNDTNIIPVGSFVLMPPAAGAVSQETPYAYAAPYIPYFPAALPLTVPTPAAHLPTVIPPHSP